MASLKTNYESFLAVWKKKLASIPAGASVWVQALILVIIFCILGALLESMAIFILPPLPATALNSHLGLTLGVVGLVVYLISVMASYFHAKEHRVIYGIATSVGMILMIGANLPHMSITWKTTAMLIALVSFSASMIHRERLQWRYLTTGTFWLLFVMILAFGLFVTRVL